MNIKPKYVAKYNVWLELHNELIYICDRDKNNSFLLGTLTEKGIARNRDVTKEQFKTIALLYSTAERYFLGRGSNGQKNKINKAKSPKYVAKYNLWLELREEDIYICFLNKDNDFVLGTLTNKGIARNRSVNEEKSIIIGLLYVIAERHFCPSTKESIDRTTARFININRRVDSLMFKWQAWLELENQEVYLYNLSGDKYTKIAKFTDITNVLEILSVGKEEEINVLIDKYKKASKTDGKQIVIIEKHITFILDNIFNFTLEDEDDSLFFFRMEIFDICKTNARRFFCPKYRKEQQALKQLRHKQKYKLIQDAINKYNS